MRGLMRVGEGRPKLILTVSGCLKTVRTVTVLEFNFTCLCIVSGGFTMHRHGRYLQMSHFSLFREVHTRFWLILPSTTPLPPHAPIQSTPNLAPDHPTSRTHPTPCTCHIPHPTLPPHRHSTPILCGVVFCIRWHFLLSHEFNRLIDCLNRLLLISVRLSNRIL